MRWACVAVLTAALVGAAAVPAGAVPPGPVTARCAFSYSPAITPGIGLLTSAGTVSSGGESGSVECTGTLRGHEITGPGTWGFEGTYSEANCAQGGKGFGRILMTLPTAGGQQHFSEAISFAFGPVGAYPPLVGDWLGQRTTGIYVVVPSEGDCVSAPVTRVDAVGRTNLYGA